MPVCAVLAGKAIVGHCWRVTVESRNGRDQGLIIFILGARIEEQKLLHPSFMMQRR